MNSPYISRVQIKNYRNFKEIDVSLGHKQVIIGENNVGKTNFLMALQLILDPTLSDNDRRLNKNDFHDSLDAPMEIGETIEISIEIRGYENILQLVAGLRDAVISDAPPTLKLVYSFQPVRDENKVIIDYEYKISKGDNNDNRFTHDNRRLLNLKVIKALRDVERELKGLKKSPVFQLVEQFNIPDKDLEDIADELKEAANAVMDLDEIKAVRDLITNRFHSLSGKQFDNDLTLSTFDIDPERLLHTLQILIGAKPRPVSEVSLGLCNILYITLMLLLIRDKTIPETLRKDKMAKLVLHDPNKYLEKFFTLSEGQDSFILNKDLEQDTDYWNMYSILNRHYNPSQGFTILAIEEPEAHLHPVLQRQIYREVLQKSEASVIFSTHSTYITSITPIKSIVHFRRDLLNGTKVRSSNKLLLNENDKEDLERYLDARRGEIYFGAGVIFVEGIAEEFLIPAFAELLKTPLDYHQIVVCNVNSAYFVPYVKLLNELTIPWCLITDGDYYVKEIETDKDGNSKEKKVFHQMKATGVSGFSQGLGVARKTLEEIGVVKDEDSGINYREFFKSKGCFVGNYTLEIDIMAIGGEVENNIIKKVYSEIKHGGEQQQKNFDTELDAENYWKALKKIENNAGKGRFAQRLASKCNENQIPLYVKEAIGYIIEKAERTNE